MILIERKNGIRYSREPVFEKLQVYSSQKTLCNGNSTLSFPSGSFHRLLFLLRGEGEICTSDSIFPTRKNDCIFLSKNRKYLLKSHVETEAIVVNFTFDGDFLKEEFCIVENAIELNEYFSQISDLERFHLLLNGTKEAIVLLIFNKIQTLRTGTSEQLRIYRKCCTWAEENAYRCATVKELSNALKYTPEHLNRIVRLYGNTTLGNLLVSTRLQKITLLAKDGNYTLSELAKRFDFYSTEHLRKFYRYHTGQNLSKLFPCDQQF